jgi:tetratricopeptide (TPR) repeat protein
LPITTAELGYAYALSRRFGEALPLLEQGTQRISGKSLGVLWIGWLGESYLLAGRMEDAARVGWQALELSRNRKERGYEAWALRLLGDIAAQRVPLDAETAEVHYRQALTLAGELGMRPLVAHCHLGLGKFYNRAGDRAKAGDHVATATTMYREMDMRFYLTQAEAALGETP